MRARERSRRRPGLPPLGWLGAGLTLGAAALLVVLGVRSRAPAPQAAPTSPAAGAATPRGPTPFSVELEALPPATELPPGTLRVLTLGDSVAQKLGLALRYRQDEAHAFVAARGVGDCSILRDQRLSAARAPDAPGGGCAARWVDDVRALRPDVTLIVLGGAFLARVRDGRDEWDACQAPWQGAYDARLEELLAAMAPFAGRVVLATVPYPLGGWSAPGVPERVDCFNALVTAVAARPGRARLDLAGHVCPTPACVVTSGGAPLRPDGLHFDGVGVEATARWVLGELGSSRNE